MEEELLDLNVDDVDEEACQDSGEGINFEIPPYNSDNDKGTIDENTNGSEEQRDSHQEINNTATDEGQASCEDTNTLKRAGDDMVGQPTKKQHIIDLTEHETEPMKRDDFNGATPAYGCKGCSSFFVSRIAHDVHKTLWSSMGNKRHAIRYIKRPANQIAEIIDLSKTVPKWTSKKAERIPNNVIIKRPTLDAVNSKAFADSIVKDADSTTTHPQTYIPLVPVSNKKLVPIHPEPGMMTLILNSVKCAVLFDLDNMAKWCNLRKPVKDVFIWGFCGNAIPGLPLWKCKHFDSLAEKQRLWITKCGKGANSADFGISYHAAQLGFLLPIHVPILIISGDRDLFHAMGHLLSSGRRTFMYDKRFQLFYIDDMITHAFNEMEKPTTTTTTTTTSTTTSSTPSTPSSKPTQTTNHSTPVSRTPKNPPTILPHAPLPIPYTPISQNTQTIPPHVPPDSSGVIVIE